MSHTKDCPRYNHDPDNPACTCSHGVEESLRLIPRNPYDIRLVFGAAALAGVMALALVGLNALMQGLG